MVVATAPAGPIPPPSAPAAARLAMAALMLPAAPLPAAAADDGPSARVRVAGLLPRRCGARPRAWAAARPGGARRPRAIGVAVRPRWRVSFAIARGCRRPSAAPPAADSARATASASAATRRARAGAAQAAARAAGAARGARAGAEAARRRALGAFAAPSPTYSRHTRLASTRDLTRRRVGRERTGCARARGRRARGDAAASTALRPRAWERRGELADAIARARGSTSGASQQSLVWMLARGLGACERAHALVGRRRGGACCALAAGVASLRPCQ